ncbi:Steroidogenic acute regulatory-like protein 1 [Toxocara canis]|uniref:Steroidogenic acute regulatory-like protein 1 n=1 Tax=Toxocara canis TaxID=6265 RepID=A0A0B2VDN3_TOXCA|nr:Steroidogenic acute regulatory-like protein 1 [Toxocara canis]
MPHSITVAGVTDTLEPQHEKYGEALKLAADAMNDVLLVLNTPEFETMEGWKKKKENKSDIVYSKRFEFGKVFTLRTEMDAPRQQLFDEHWDNFVETAKLNKNTSLAEKVAVLSPHVEIIHYAMKDSGLVKGRDFVTSRIYRRVGDDIIEAARSYETDEVERYKKKIRGNLILGGGRLRVHPKDPNKTIIDYLVCLDFNGPDLTKPVVESTLSKFILQDAEWAKEQIEKKKAEK